MWEKMAMAVGARAVRPCDVCGVKRSSLYCAADEAYLCEPCDTSVHAANALASRHERVRLTPSGVPMKKTERRNSNLHIGNPHESPIGGKRKYKSKSSAAPPAVTTAPLPASSPLPAQFPQASHPPLPESSNVAHQRAVKVETESNCSEPCDRFTAEELTGTANILDSPSRDPCTFESSVEGGEQGVMLQESDFGHDFLISDPGDCPENAPSDLYECSGGGIEDSGEWISSAGAGELDLRSAGDDRDLSDDEYCVDLEALRSDQSTLNYNTEAGNTVDLCNSFSGGRPFKGVAGQAEWVKLEEGGSVLSDQALSVNCKMEGWNDSDMRQVPSLRLDYADVLTSWSDRGTLWTEDSHHPQLVPDESTNSEFLGGAGSGCFDQQQGLVPDLGPPGCSMGNGGQPNSIFDAGSAREARVSRYREKRRTRLFSKKIRYEVRKLNAERRPRMKGRFVKRSPGNE